MTLFSVDAAPLQTTSPRINRPEPKGSDYLWEELVVVTERLARLRDERKQARYVGDLRLRDQCHAQIEDLLDRRSRLVRKLAKNSSKIPYPDVPHRVEEPTVDG